VKSKLTGSIPGTDGDTADGPRAPAGWGRFLARRTVRLMGSLLVLLTTAFLLVRAVPGDPIRAALGQSADPATVERLRRELGFDKPIWEQYLDFIGGLFTGDLGRSIGYQIEVSRIISERVPATLTIAVVAFVIVIVAGIPIGLLAAVRAESNRRRREELTFAAVTSTLSAVPEFLIAVALVFVFSVQLALFPAAGRSDASSYVLPVLSLCIVPAAILARIVQTETLRVLGEDFIRTARAKRLPERLTLARHAVPNILTSTLTVSGLILASMIAGTVLVETVFAWPGLGTTLLRGIITKDYPLVQGLALFYGGGILLINFVVDLLLGWLDPRSVMRTT
jgi:peptide/nickel transport system permease protein